MDFPALGCYRQHWAPHFPNFSFVMYHRRAMEKKRDNLGSTWRPVQRLGGQLLTQFLTRSRRGWWVRASRSIDLGYKLRSPQSIRPFRCLWADLTGSACQTTSESFTFTDDSNGDTFYVCKANLDFAIRVTTGQSKLEGVWKIKKKNYSCAALWQRETTSCSSYSSTRRQLNHTAADLRSTVGFDIWRPSHLYFNCSEFWFDTPIYHTGDRDNGTLLPSQGEHGPSLQLQVCFP